MVIFLFTETLKKLYDYVSNTGQNLDIKFELKKKHELKTPGICALIIESNLPFIMISIREDMLNEDVVSHELLHALNAKRGFGQTNYTTFSGIPFDHIALLLKSIMEHKYIYKAQKDIGINIAQSQIHKANTLFKNTEKEPSIVDYNTIVNSLLLLECFVAASEYSSLFIDRVKLNFNNTYTLSKTLENELFEQNLDTPEIFRKKFIKALRIFDDFLSSHMTKSIPHLKFTDNISISYIPSEYQLLLKAEQIFDFRCIKDEIIIISKKDNQASYIIKNSINVDTLKPMKAEELIGRMDGIVTIRTKK